MLNSPGQHPHPDDEHAVREQAVADALRGAYAPPPGRLHVAYHIAYSLVTRMRATVEQDLRSGHFAPPTDPAECQVYASLYRALQRPAPPPATGETQRLSSGPQGPRATGRCPDCLGQLEPIWIVDEGRQGRQQDLVYTRPGTQPSFWLGTFPVLGRVEAFICAVCGRIYLYGLPISGR